MLIELDKIIDPRGNLTVAQGHDKVPFDIRRAYWVYDVPGGESRGGHAHKQCTYLLNRPWQGLLVGTGVWRTLDDFSSGAVCVVLASDDYDEADYIRSYDEFISYTSGKR